MAVLELSVHMDCPGCGNKIKRALQKLDGVENVDVDMELQKVTVTGYIDHEKVLKTVKRTGKRAELWPVPFNPSYHNFDEYYSDQYPYNTNPNRNQSSNPNPNPNPNPPINYYKNTNTNSNPPINYYVVESISSDVHGYHQPPYSVFNQPTTAMFSDENAHACVIM